MTLYLIAHVVRGEPAFDIAIKAEDMGTDTDPGPWWIMPSTGHRCYPYWDFKLDSLFSYVPADQFMWGPPPPPEDHPDFCGYEIGPPTSATAGKDLLSQLGLLKSKEPIKRRV